jgi:hypothetical protein
MGRGGSRNHRTLYLASHSVLTVRCGQIKCGGRAVVGIVVFLSVASVKHVPRVTTGGSPHPFSCILCPGSGQNG